MGIVTPRCCTLGGGGSNWVVSVLDGTGGGLKWVLDSRGGTDGGSERVVGAWVICG